MTQSNIANGHNYFDLDIQVVSADANTYVLRAVVYLTTYNVVDPSNNLTVGGGFWGRSGTLGLSGVYDHAPVWYQDIAIARVPGVNQTISVYASWSGVQYWGVTLEAVNAYVVPAKVTPPGAPSAGWTSIGTTTARLVFTAFGADNGSAQDLAWYRAYRNSDGALIGEIQTDGGGCTFSGLARGTGYTGYLATHNAAGWSPWSAGAALTTLSDPPTMSTSYTATTITRNSAIISSLSVSDNGGSAPDDVRVQYNTTPSATGATVVTRGTWANVSLTGLTDLTTYYYRVAAHNAGGWGAYPATWKSFTTLDDAPNDMAAPTFSSVTDTTFRVEWVAPSMNGAMFSAYRYEISLTDTFSSLIKSGTTTALFIDVTGLIPGTLYYARVRANATPSNGGYGVASQRMTGIVPQSGMRSYTFIGGERKQGDLYTFVAGQRKGPLKPMWQDGATLQTE